MLTVDDHVGVGDGSLLIVDHHAVLALLTVDKYAGVPAGSVLTVDNHALLALCYQLTIMLSCLCVHS